MIRALASVALLLGLTPFETCGSASPDEVDLPRSTREGCTFDSECADVDMCADVRCLAGECTVVSPFRDMDGDGEGPVAGGCGDDCDDADPFVNPSAIERCDGVDQDCDGRIDEDAPATSFGVDLAIGDRRAILTRGGDTLLIVDATDSALFARELTRSGDLGTPFEIMRLSRGGAFVSLHAKPRDDRTLLIARTDIGALRYVVLGEGGAVLEGPTDLAIEGQVEDLHLITHGGGWAMAADVLPEAARAMRVVYPAFDGVPRDIEELATDMEPPPLDLASTGGELAVTVTDGIRFVGGADFMVPGELAPGPLANGDGHVVVAFDDGVGIAFQRLDPVDGFVGEAEPGPRTSTRDTRIDEVAGNIGIFNDSSGQGWVLAPNLRAYVRSTITVGARDGGLTMAVVPNATALYGAGSGSARAWLFVDCEG